MYLDPLGSAGGCTPNTDGSGCPGDVIADKAFGTCGTGADGTGDLLPTIVVGSHRPTRASTTGSTDGTA